MGMLKTRYQKAEDATYEAAAPLQASRLVKLSAAGDVPAKPKVVHTANDNGSEQSVGASLTDYGTGDDATIVHRAWQLLEAGAAIVFGEDVYPVANGRIRGAANIGATALSGSAKAYGKALNAAAAAGDFVWVKVYK